MCLMLRHYIASVQAHYAAPFAASTRAEFGQSFRQYVRHRCIALSARMNTVVRYAVSHQQPVIRSERRMKVDILRTLPLTQLANTAICTQNKLGKTILVKRRAKVGGQHLAERHRRFRVLRCTLEQRLEIAEQLRYHLILIRSRLPPP